MTQATEEQTWKLKHQETGEEVCWTRDQILEEINRDRSDSWSEYDQGDPWEHALEHWTDWRFLPVYRLRIEQDGNPEKPRWDPITVFATWCDRYTIGDLQPKGDPDEWLISQLSEAGQDEWERFQEEDLPSVPSAAYGSREWKEWNRETERLQREKVQELVEKEYFILPVSAYIHSGITISTGSFGCPWDSGQIGWIICDRERAKKEFAPGADVLQIMRDEIELYDTYLRGNVWGFIVEKKLGDGDWEHEDSCWGFYGDSVEELRPDMECNFSQEFTDEEWERAWDERRLGY